MTIPKVRKAILIKPMNATQSGPKSTKIRFNFQYISLSIVLFAVVYSEAFQIIIANLVVPNSLLACNGEHCEDFLFPTDQYDYNKTCGPFKASTLIFPLVPGGLSIEVSTIINNALKEKGVPLFTHDEWIDAVPLLKLPKKETGDMNINSKGYYKFKKEGYSPKARFTYFRELTDSVFFPKGYRLKVSNFSVHQGNFFHLNWTEAHKMYDPPQFWKRAFGDWFPVAQNILFPQPTIHDQENVFEIYLLEEPWIRLQRMYKMNRNSARSQRWRDQYKREKGDLDFFDCILDKECSRRNELKRWCSIQTESLCGLHSDCMRPLKEVALIRAKETILRSNVITLTLQNWKQTAEMLSKGFPRYFETLSSEFKSIPNQQTLNSEIIEALNDICSLDNELYAFVSQNMKVCLG